MSEREALEEARRQSDQRYREIFENAVEGIYRSTPQGRYVSVNPAFASMMGYSSPEELITSVKDIGKELYVNEEDRKHLGRLLKELGSVRGFEAEGITKDGRNIWVSINAHAIRGVDGEIEFYEGTQEDITDKKLAEKALSESEGKYRSLYESMTDAFVTVDIKGHLKEWNKAFEDMIGYSGEELRRMSYRDLTPQKWHSFEENIVKNQVLTRGSSDVYEKEYRRKDGTIFPVELRTFLIRDSSGKPSVMWAIVRDISDRERVRSAQLASEERFRQVAEVAGEFIWETDKDGIYTYASPVVEDILGYRPDELIGKMHFYDLFAPESRQTMKASIMAIRAEGREIHRMENQNVHKDGHPVILLTNGLPVRNEQGAIIGYRGADMDITDRKKAEQVLRQINKKLNLLNAITRHDALNQISGIIGYTSLLEMKGLSPSQADYIKKIDKAARTIQNQLEFTRVYQDIGMQDPSWQRLKDSVDKARNGLPLGDLKVEVGNLDYQVWADPLLAKVIYNLIDNTLRHGVSAKLIGITTEERNGKLVIIIQDDGVGISDEDRAYLFVRGHGKNSGYGLFLTREVLAITDATIEECGVKGKGARFEITFPRFGWRRNGNL
jgi:PAS domain S-box-containing protein